MAGPIDGQGAHQPHQHGAERRRSAHRHGAQHQHGTPQHAAQQHGTHRHSAHHDHAHDHDHDAHEHGTPEHGTPEHGTHQHRADQHRADQHRAERGPTLIQSVQRALRLLEVVGEREGRASAKEIARAARLPLATTYHLLRTCAHEGWLQRLDDGTYVLGHRLDIVRGQGRAARGVAHARPALEWLRDTLGSAVYLARHVDGEVVIVEIVDSPKAPRIDLWVGVHDAAHATALGKCILGQLPAREREDYLARHPLHDLTPRTATDRRRLKLPAPGAVAVDEEEYALGVSCLAVPVVPVASVEGVEGVEGVGSLGFVTAPGSRVPVQEQRHALRVAAARVSRALALS
ncbi:MAG TPA: IclR family transcriptional regulator C-terminal domain-containing protein [Pseudonocardia sp.]|nr:IclR family transcriptional regulator C-terminal domain-containing protein [Pseudonocardia sp.]